MARPQLQQLTPQPKEEEADDASFIRTEDVVCLLCSSGDGMKRGYLAADGFGSEFCYLESEAREEEACELWKCTFQLEEALSVHAMSTYKSKKKQVQRKILMYGQAVLLRHQGTKKLLRCLSSSPANDKLAHHIGFREKQDTEPGMVDGSCWFLVCPSSKQRSDGEKVHAGDDIFLRNVSNERYLSAQLSYLQNVESDSHKQSNIVQASFQQSVWTLDIVCSGSAREAAIGYVNGTDVIHLLHRHGAEDCLSVAVRSCDKNTIERTCSEVCYQCPLMAPLRTLWRVELFKMKFGGGFAEWRQPFRLRHVVTGKFLGVRSVHRSDVRSSGCVGGKRDGVEGEREKVQAEKAGDRHTVSLLEPSEATFTASAFCFTDATSPILTNPIPTTSHTSNISSREMMGQPQVKFGDSEVLLVHLDTGKLIGCPVSERSNRHLLGGREKRKVMVQRERHQGQSFTVTRASEEKAKAGDVVQLMEGTMRNYVQKVLCCPSTEHSSYEHFSHNLLHLLTDLTHYFHLPPPPTSHTSTHNSNTATHDSWQAELCLLRERQELFQKQGMLILILNVIIETGSKCRRKCSPISERIHHKLYELLAVMIRGNHNNCRVFATEKWLKVFIDQLSMPLFTHDVLEVIQCLLTDSPEVLNIITKEHIQVIVNLLLSRGRDDVVMRLLSSLCVSSEVAVRDKQRLIYQHLLDCRDLLIQTSLHDHIHCLHPGLYIGSNEGGASSRQKWYYEAEIMNLPTASTVTDDNNHEHLHLRVGWAHATLFHLHPSSNSVHTTSGGVGDDLYSIAFDGEYFWFGGESFQYHTQPPVTKKKGKLERQGSLSSSPIPPPISEESERKGSRCGKINVGDVIGCYLDLSRQEVWFSKNGEIVPGVLRFSHLNDMITPAISISSSIGMMLSYGKTMGEFAHPPPSDFAGLFEAAGPSGEEMRQHPFITLGTTEDLAVSGPDVLVSYEGFVPAPIDNGGLSLPDSLHSIKDRLAQNLHEVWAKNKIEAGYKFSEVRNDSQKLHPMLCPISSLPLEDSQYDYTMAHETLATLLVLGYHIVPPDSQHTQELHYQELDEEYYRQSNGYIPRPLDLDSIRLEEHVMSLVTRLAENCHNVWAAARIKQGWTYGRSTDIESKRNPSLVPYDKLDELTTKSNWDSAHDTVRTVIALGCSINPPSSSSLPSDPMNIHKLSRDYSESQAKIRNFRGQTNFAVTSGKWYYEVKLLTEGMMRVGWASTSYPAHLPLGNDDQSYAFDGYLVCKWHSGKESFGQRWSSGDVIGCLLDMDAGQVAFSLNGEFLQDSLGSNIAFEGVVKGMALVPAITLAAGQRAQLNFGRSEEALRNDYSSLGFKPLCSPSCLNFNIPLWYSSPHESLEPITPTHSRLLVTPTSSDLTPNSRSSHSVLSVSCRDWDYSQNAHPEFLRLNIGVFVTPNTSMESLHSLTTTLPHSVHSRHLDSSTSTPISRADANYSLPFSNYFTPSKNTVSYTAVLPAGQDPRSVFLGWTTAQFRYVASQFQTGSAWNCGSLYGQKLECIGVDSGTGTDSSTAGIKYSYSSAYLVCVKELLTGFTDQNLVVSIRVICTLDLLSGHMTFSTLMPGQEVSPETSASHKTTLSVKTHCKLFPTVITTPSTEKVIDFDFIPDLCCNSISSTITPASAGAKLPPCPPRFKIMVLTPSKWIRQPFRKVPYTSMITSGGAVKVKSYKEPTYRIYATLPEEDQVMNLLEISEHKKLLEFHISTLKAYRAVVSHCNEIIARKINLILYPKLLLHCLKMRGMNFTLCEAYIDLFNTLHLEPEVSNRLITRGEFIFPLSACHRSIPLFLPTNKQDRNYRQSSSSTTTPDEADKALLYQATITHNVQSSFPCDRKQCRLLFSVKELKQVIFYHLEKLLYIKYHEGILLPKKNNSEVLVPLLTLLDNLLVVGAVREQEDLSRLLILLEPKTFGPKGTPFHEGLLSTQVAVEEPIKLALCSILQHLCDCQIEHRVESTVAFAASYVESLQKDQKERHGRTFAKKPKEFRSSPKMQMENMLSFKHNASWLECPTPADLRKVLNDFHNDLKRHCGVCKNSASCTDNMTEKSLTEKLKTLAVLLRQALFISDSHQTGNEGGMRGKYSGLQRLIMTTMIHWAQQPIQSPELIQQIFTLLYRQCDEISEVVTALQKTYVIDVVEDEKGKMNFNIPDFRRALGSLRLLLKIGMGREEEQVLKECLRTISHSGIFYCHPHLLRSLGVHLTVLGLMRSYLGISVTGMEEDKFLTARRKMKMAMSKEGLPTPVEWCCKFLCSFARVSSDNQKALFDHISYLLEHSEKNPGCMTCRGCTPLDVATATIRDNTELCLALDDVHLRHVVSLLVTTTTSVTGGGGSMEQGSGGGGDDGREVSMMCEWAPNGGEKCLEFLQCAVWADGEQIQENAYVIVRLLIHHPECLGPALTGEAIGLHRVYEDALEHMFDTPQYNSSCTSPRDSTDLGSAYPTRVNSLSRGETIITTDTSPLNDSHSGNLQHTSSYMNLNLMSTQLVLSFYTSLVRLLAYCAPVEQVITSNGSNGRNGTNNDPILATSGLNGTTNDTTSGLSGAGSGSGGISMKKSGSERTRNILSNLISVSDVKGVLCLPFARDGRRGIVPAHKEAAVLFLSRVYGVTDAQLLRDLLTDAFLPDIKTALKLHVSSGEEQSPLSGPLLHYLCTSVFPLLTQYTSMLPQLLTHLHVLVNLLVCCCRLGSTCQLTSKQLSSVTTFLVSALRCLHPKAIRRFMPKIIADIPSLPPHTVMYMEILTSHFSYYARYYESGQRCIGSASEEEKVWSALVVYRLLDTLSTNLPQHEKMERNCLACLQAITCTIAPDTLLPSQCQLSTMYQSSAVGYDPHPSCVTKVTILKPEVKQFVNDYASFVHDCWVFDQQSAGWTYGSEYCEERHDHPNLQPLSSLPTEAKMEYVIPIEEAIKNLIVRGFCMNKVKAADLVGIPMRQKMQCLRRKKKKDGSGESEIPYEPEVLDLSKVSTPIEVLAMAEMMAEDAHDRWASDLKKTTVDYQCHPFFQPYELVDDVIKEERRSYALDFLRYMRVTGFELLRTGKIITSLAQSRQSSVCQERFSLQLFDKFNRLLSEKHEPVYYSRVLFPTLANYLNHHRKYFIPVAGQKSAHSATREEKLLLLRLFCRVMDYAHTHKTVLFSSIHRRGKQSSVTSLYRTLSTDKMTKTQQDTEDLSEEKGSLFREIQLLIESIVKSLDLRAIVAGSGSVADHCPNIITFFKQAHETVESTKSEMLRHNQLKKNSHLQSYTLSLLIPALTVLFKHIGFHDMSRLLIQGTVLAHCRVIFQNLVEMATGVTPVFVGTSPMLVIGRCLGAFSRAYPDPFLEKRLFGFDLESLLSQLDMASTQGSTAGNVLYVVDIVIPVLSNYITKWWSGPTLDCSAQDQVDYTLSKILSLVTAHFTLPMSSVRWFVHIIDSSLALSQKCSFRLLSSQLLPMCVGLAERAVTLWHREKLITATIAGATSSSSASSEVEGYMEELVSDYNVLVRDLATTLLFLTVFLKSHSDKLRAAGKKMMEKEERKSCDTPREDISRDVNALFTAVAEIFHCWFSSPHFRRVFLAGTQWLAQNSILKCCMTVLSLHRGEDSTGNSSSRNTYNLLMITLSLLLPIVDQFLTRSDRDLVNCYTDKLGKKGASYEDIKAELIQQLNMQEQMQSQEHLAHKLVRSISRTFISDYSSTETKADHIVGLARVRHRIIMVDKPEDASVRSKWRRLFTRRKKKAVLACFLAVPYFQISKHRAINMFLQTYCEEWLQSSTEGHTHTALSHELLDLQDHLVTHKRSSLPPNYHDPLTQLFTMMKRRATSGKCFDYELFTAYPNVLSKIITGYTDAEGTKNEENVTVAYQSYYKRRAELFTKQNQLAKRGAASMVLLVITAAQGKGSPVIHSILRLGIALLEEGNSLVQGQMLTQLRTMDVGFLTSVARLVTGCSVLDWNAYERYQKSEMMQSSTSLAMTKVLSESDFTEDLFRFLQLLCEGHNADFQNYLRTQAGNTTTVNIITCTVDYLLRLQESISNFYWHYSGQEIIDLLGRDSLLKAFRVAKQVFRTLTEYIQGPCVQNQETLSRSRLLDAVSGFIQVFAILQRKLYRDTSQMELLRELLALQEEMFILLLSMLEGSAMSSQLGRLMVDMLVESEQWVQDIMAFFSIFIKLKDAATSKAFKEYDLNKDGMISYREFEMAMESQQRYSKEEIAYLMDCADTNRDGLLDYMEFTERFHQPAENIGFHLCVLLVHLSEHLPLETRLNQFKWSPQGRELMDHFQQGMGSIEILGKSGRIERVYFDVKQSRLVQWNETQIKESRRNFLHSVEMGSHKKKLEGFISFCEDTIFEMDYADKISGSEQLTRENRAFQHRLRHTKALQTPPQPILQRLLQRGKVLWVRHRPLQRTMTLMMMMWSLLMILTRPLITFTVSLVRRGGVRLYAMGYALIRKTTDHTPSPSHDSTHSTTSASRTSRLGTIAQKRSLRLIIPPKPSDHPIPSMTTPPNAPDHRPHFNRARSSVPTQNGTSSQNGTQTRRHTLSASSISEGLRFLFPWKQAQAKSTPLITSTIHQQSLHYNRSRMRRPSSDNSQTIPQGDQISTSGIVEESYIPKITLSTRGWQAFIARHYYHLNNLKLLTTFFINIVLLSFTVHSFTHDQAAMSSGVCSATPSPPPSPSSPFNSSSSNHTPSLLCKEEVKLVWNPFYLQLLSGLHFFLSLLLIFSYWNLKVPLIIFKREKAIARKLEMNQMWVWSRLNSPGVANLWDWSMTEWWVWFHDCWDGIVISAPSFPRNYWDKQVKDRVCYQFEGNNRNLVEQRLGMRKRCRFMTRSKWADVAMALTSLGDLRYFVWMVGTVLSDMMVLYHILYCGLSFLGLHQNSFYFSIHLLDFVMNFKLLRTVLYSVLHNGKQLIMTVLMTCVVIYLYTVIAFNYFRKFYVQHNHADGERVYTCDSMAKCFIYHIDKGLRAGGGIGDVLQSASGDPDEILRLLFDVTFFFFVIIILLAIIQGLIIDAFGELRDREESITSDMKNKCFVCGLPKAEFDHIAHGFDNHVNWEHNVAHYMFFLLYLIRKQESEFSGQESYVWEMYLKRRWDFFPVGDSFRSQEERRQQLAKGTGSLRTVNKLSTAMATSPSNHSRTHYSL